jgi:D-alanyl-D-alanine carboxypeptidase
VERLHSAGKCYAQVIALVFLACLTFASNAQAKQHEAIVIDAETGKVLHAVNADARTYPASLTKMMTLYLVFDALDSGRLKLDQHLTVSRHAAGQAPSKLGLRRGESISVHDLILALVTKSANDAAVVLAEGLADSESAFARQMTAQARKLGMKNTVFRNASGLPNRAQHTTARDIAILARALYQDFPQYYHWFSTEKFTYRGRTYTNHNHLMSTFEGMDGIKTGFINASGFNLAASAVRDNRRLIGVVMGGRSARARDKRMAALLNKAFAHKFVTPTLVADDGDDGDDSPGDGDSLLSNLSPVSSAEAATPASTRTVHHASTRWSIQVGAFSKRSSAVRAAGTAVARLPHGKSKPVKILAPFRGDKVRFYRARLTHFTKSEAYRACHTLRRKHVQCAVVGPRRS